MALVAFPITMKVFIRLFVTGYIVGEHLIRSIFLLLSCSIMIASIGMLLRVNMAPDDLNKRESVSL